MQFIYIKKRIINLVIILSTVFVSIFSVNAATSVKNDGMISTISLSMIDINHLAEVMTNIRGKQVRVVNVVRCENDSTAWIVRTYVESGGYVEDFALTPYLDKTNAGASELKVLPFSTVEEGKAILGPSWYYYGIYDENSRALCGYVVAEKIRRSSKWNDKEYSGSTYRGVRYKGSYAEDDDVDFIKKHPE